MKYRKKPVLTEATQWFTNGDHPQDNTVPITLPGGEKGRSEGKVVQYFRALHIPGLRRCPNCGNPMHLHGLLEGINGEEIICPGDYIVTNRHGRYYKLSAADFETQYESYSEPEQTMNPGSETITSEK